MRITLIGSTGQLGQDLSKAFQSTHDVIGLRHQEIEVTDKSSVVSLKQQKPDVIVNTAAFHKTDLCEDEPLKAFAVNAVGPKNVAEVSTEIGATAVFISTDYVFSGSKNQPYIEDDVPDPINTYGISKLAGEFFTRQSPRHYVFRVASLFGVAGASGKGGNFVETMLRIAKEGLTSEEQNSLAVERGCRFPGAWSGLKVHVFGGHKRQTCLRECPGRPIGCFVLVQEVDGQVLPVA